MTHSLIKVLLDSNFEQKQLQFKRINCNKSFASNGRSLKRKLSRDGEQQSHQQADVVDAML